MSDNDAVPSDDYDVANPRWYLATRLRDVLLRRWSAEIQAIGVHGSMAHGDDVDGSDVNVVVVTYRKSSGPRSALRRVDGTLVDLTVVTGEDGLRQARELPRQTHMRIRHRRSSRSIPFCLTRRSCSVVTRARVDATSVKRQHQLRNIL